jgi:SAM-dependent methyltransferase
MSASEPTSHDSPYSEFGFSSSAASHMHKHFMPHLIALAGPITQQSRVLDVGCGNGYTCGRFLELGAKVTGIDLSEEGIRHARREYPQARFERISVDEDFLLKLNEEPFDLVISTEVVEHLYAPRRWARACYRALKPGGRFICTTPYHGYLKNLLISLMGNWDKHANPMWDGGHIKLWSWNTIRALLDDAGFVNFKFAGAGRLPGLWMTMVIGADKPK